MLSFYWDIGILGYCSFYFYFISFFISFFFFFDNLNNISLLRSLFKTLVEKQNWACVAYMCDIFPEFAQVKAQVIPRGALFM
jgi:hypothetical protein